MDHAVEQDDEVVLLGLLVDEPAPPGEDQGVLDGIFHGSKETIPPFAAPVLVAEIEAVERQVLVEDPGLDPGDRL